MAKDYAETLNLPKTDFPMRANLPAREPAMLEEWEKNGLYQQILRHNESKPSFVMHDGPPYANGNIHTGHALNKIIKDMIVKNKNMSGYYTPYTHGWDTHGLPIELQMLKKNRVKLDEIDTVAFRELCRKFALEQVDIQKNQMKRLGCIGNFDEPYLTLRPEFEARQVEIFGQMAEKGYIYKGMKPVYWCAHCETALAEAEVEYEDDGCDSIYVRFAVEDDKGLFTPVTKTLDHVYYVIWTTTTWTLPGNVAICLGPEFDYALVQYGMDYYVIAKELISAFETASGLSAGIVKAQFKGADLEYTKARHPFLDRHSMVIVGDHVGLDSGTGCVHTAPGHGMDDYLVCKKYPELDLPVPVDSKGRLNALAGKYAGLPTQEANRAIWEDLNESGALVATEHIVHQYPHCWRCKHPIVYRATEQWFCSVDGFKDTVLRAIKDVEWIPSWGETRIENMVRDRSDWCISRQRRWGVPIPIVYCEQCGKAIVTRETIRAIASLFEREGSNAWFRYSASQILPEGTRCDACGSTAFTKETDIMDVWFDSGSSYASVLNGQKGYEFPADLYLEGNDQYRGWFQSSLLTSCATRGVAPYRSVLTHGMVVDGEGKKMSKSLGNGIDPLEVVRDYGADVLRLWVSSVDITADARISKEILKQLAEIYRKIRNTLRILLANLGTPADDFDPQRDLVPVGEMLPLDRWIMTQYNDMVKRIRSAYDRYEFHLIYHDIHNFCTIDLSKLYIDITKDRVYVQAKDSAERRSAQSAMYLILNGMTRLIAPILSFTAEEAWGYIAHAGDDCEDSVFLNDLPSYREDWHFGELAQQYNRLFDVRDDVMKALENARADKKIGKSLDAAVTIYGDRENEAMQLFHSFEEELKDIFICSQVFLSHDAPPAGAFQETEHGIAVLVEQARGKKCDRCWYVTQDGEESSDGGYLCARCCSLLPKMH